MLFLLANLNENVYRIGNVWNIFSQLSKYSGKKERSFKIFLHQRGYRKEKNFSKARTSHPSVSLGYLRLAGISQLDINDD